MTSYVYVCFTVRFHASDRSGDNMSQVATLVPVQEICLDDEGTVG